MAMLQRETQAVEKGRAVWDRGLVTLPPTYAALLQSLSGGPIAPFQRFLTPQGVVERDCRAAWTAALEYGSRLKSLGLVPGERVGIVVTDPWDFLPLVQGCLLFGLVAVPMYPPPLFTRLQSYQTTLATILQTADVKVVITDVGLATRIGGLPAERVIELGQLPAAEVASPAWVEPGDLALLQFTSGSTATPRGVRITHGALMANIHAFAVEGLDANPRDHGVSWLPLFHDMGLIGFGLAPALTRTPVTYIPTARFVRNPAIWLETIHETRATITFAPNFAYSLVTRRVIPSDLNLSCVRMWGCGAEPISERVMENFERHFAHCGVKPRSVAPCYGLAEATLAVTFAPPGSDRVVHHLDSTDWESRGHARNTESGTITVVSCGVPLPRYAVSIVDELGRDLGECRAGEIIVRGPSLGAGYHGDPAETARVFRDGALHTGDRGYTSEGQLFVTGRLKDTLIVNGRKYDPHVLEQCAEQVPGVRRAAAVNVDTDGGEVLVIVAERGGEEPTQLAEAVRAQLAAAIGVHTHRVLFVAVGRVPRTTSGKLRRGATRVLAERLLRVEDAQVVPGDPEQV